MDRGAIVDAFGNLQTDDHRAMNILLGALHKEMDNSLRGRACNALGKIGSAAHPSVPRLLEMLSDPENLLREGAAVALGRITPIRSTTVQALIIALQDTYAGVRSAAAKALGSVEPPTELLITALRCALQDKEDYVKVAAVEALGQIGTPARNAEGDIHQFIESLGDLVRDVDVSFCQVAEDALKRIRGEG